VLRTEHPGGYGHKGGIFIPRTLLLGVLASLTGIVMLAGI
jgi:hypothetical protein